MGVVRKCFWGLLFLGVAARCSGAQDLAPRAYVITPDHTNTVTLTYAYYAGNLEFNGAVPITGATATASSPIFNYYHSFSFFGRSANFLAALPYAVGNFQGHVLGAEKSAYRSGLLDSEFRFSVNLLGGPAMSLAEMQKWKQKVLLGVSLRVVAPTGQYDPTKLINWGDNRWAFKPEFGYSQRWGKWILDGYAGVWLFTTNPEYFCHNIYYPGTRSQSERPVTALEGHLSYDVRTRLWLSVDGNFWYGGTTGLNGLLNPDTRQTSSRVGGTASFPISKHQSIKVSYSDGAYVRFGGNYQNVSVAWQYYWIGRP